MYKWIVISILLISPIAIAAYPQLYPDATAVSGLPLSGGTMSGDINLNGNKLTYDNDTNSYVFASADDTVELFVGASQILKVDPNKEVLIGVDANSADFSKTKLVASTGDTGFTSGNITAIVGESDGNGVTEATGVLGIGATSGTHTGRGLQGTGKVGDSADTASSYGIVASCADTHAGGANFGIWTDANGGATNWAIFINRGDIGQNSPPDWDLTDNSSSALSFDTAGKLGMLEFRTANNQERLRTTTIFQWVGGTELFSSAALNGKLQITNDAGTIGVLLDVTIADTWRFRNLADSQDAAIIAGIATIDGAKYTQTDVGATCALGQTRIDTGGATKELCFCTATDTWDCIDFTTIGGPKD